MNRLTLGPTADNYSVKLYGKLRYLRNVSQSNFEVLRERVVNTNYIVSSNHLLVQILNSLSIKKEHSLEYVFSIATAERNYLSASFDLSCPNNKGKRQQDVYFSNNYREYVSLMDLDIPLEDYIEKPLEKFTPLIPLYNTNTDVSYIPLFQRKFKEKKPLNEFAIFGLDFVELAVGYWKFLNDYDVGPDGIAPSVYNYIGKWPLLNCQMLCNQLALTNILFNRTVEEKGSLGNFRFLTGQVAIIDNSVDIYEALNNLNSQMALNWHNTPLKMFNLMPCLYDLTDGNPYPNHDGGELSYFYQSGWGFQPGMAKAILLNKVYNYNVFKDIKADFTTMVNKFQMSYARFQDQITDKDLKNHLDLLYQKLFEFNKK